MRLKLALSATVAASVIALGQWSAHLWLPPVVDGVRALPGVGFGRMHRFEQRTFEVLDGTRRLFSESEASAGRIRPPPEALASVWPPVPLTPVLTEPKLPGEGLWSPFGAACRAELPGLEEAMVRTTLRVDAQRPEVETALVAMDMRRLALHLRPGRHIGGEEAGEIERVERLVGAFNGGFQKGHGDFGLVAQGRVWLAPVEGKATVATGPSGRLWLGEWRQEGPGRAVDLRQNLQPLTEGLTIAPELWVMAEGRREPIGHSLTRRSGICVRPPHTLIYAWTPRGRASALASAMLAAGCARSMHLDVNAFHTRFEALGPHGECADRLHPRMTDGPLPRYTSAQDRDFFTLSARVSPLDEPVVMDQAALGGP